MRRMFLVLTLVAGPLLVVGCSDDDGGTPTPTNRCETEGKKRCNGTMIQSCKKGADDLLDWADDSDCAGNGLSCLDNGSTVECSAGCSDSCETVDATRCRGTEIEKCEKGQDGCKAWVVQKNCTATQQVCKETGGSAACDGACQDACPKDGDSRCQGTKVETCATGGSGCLEWIAGFDCATGNWACTDTSGSATCEYACSGASTDLKNPVPADAATDAAATAEKLDWDDVTNAGSYDVYFGDAGVTGQCPPPAYPDAAYQRVTASEFPVKLVDNGSYCWKVVARDASGGCVAEGPAWTFQTGCTDPVAGAPTLGTPTTLTLAPGTTTGTVTLTFSEPVKNVSTSLTWTAVTGTGTQGAVTKVNDQVYTVAFSGLADGDEYTLAVGTGVTDNCANAMAAAVTLTIKVIAATATAGTTCSDALDITGAAGKITLTGTFADDPATGGTCDTTPTNAVWYKYTAATTGDHTIVATDTNSGSWARVAIFETAACSPYGTEVACESPSSGTVTTVQALTAGTTYLILFHTDGDSYDQVDPSITITPPLPPSQVPGETCAKPIDITGKTFPHQIMGNFTADPAKGSSCDSTLYNALWMSYTPPADGWYRLSAINTTLGSADMDIAVFEGATCDTELMCAGTSEASVAGVAYLSAAKTYKILLAADDASEPHENPWILIEPLTPAAGETCDQAMDISSATFPYTATGKFAWRPHVKGACTSSNTYNGVWFKYTPTTTGWYDIKGQLTQSTSDDADIAVFEGTGCFPIGTEIGCGSSSTDTAATLVQLTAGTTYTIVLASDSSSDDNTDPIIDIQPGTAPPEGLSCALTAKTTSPNHTVDSNNHDCWSWTEDASDTSNDHTFSCDSGVGGDVVVEYTTGASQTSLNFDAVIANYASSGYVRVEITEATCAAPASSLYCTSSTSLQQDTGVVTVTPNTTYFIWVVDGFSSHKRPDINLCLW